MLAAADVFGEVELARTVLLGELGLDGRVRPVRGILPAVLTAAQSGFSRAIVPLRQAAEAQLVADIDIIGVGSLRHLVAFMRHAPIPDDETQSPPLHPRTRCCPRAYAPVISSIGNSISPMWSARSKPSGRSRWRRPDGTTCCSAVHPAWARPCSPSAFRALLPDLDVTESLEVSAVHSLAGVDLSAGLITRPPYADPHHSASIASVVGGGPRLARPGAISCAHRGVLFLDEAPEFPPRVLEALRTPLESGIISIGRSEAQARYPARFQLVLAANPCPCGLAATKGMQCTCAPMAIRRYTDRISGPIRDRIDITQTLRPLRKSFLEKALARADSSAVVAARVAEARARQAFRLRDSGWQTNGEVPGPYLRKKLPLPDGLELVDDAVQRGRLSPRGVDKVLRLAWSLADLAGRSRPSVDELSAAVAMRRGEASTTQIRVVS